MRVLVVGAISRIKGFDVVRGIAQVARAASLPLEVALLGYSMDDPQLRESGVNMLGRYFDNELAQKIEDHDPHIIFVPSIWPETYCYVLSGALHSGRRIAVFDLGAQAERTREHHPEHLVLPLALADRPEELARVLVQGGQPPAHPAMPALCRPPPDDSPCGALIPYSLTTGLATSPMPADPPATTGRLVVERLEGLELVGWAAAADGQAASVQLLLDGQAQATEPATLRAPGRQRRTGPAARRRLWFSAAACRQPSGARAVHGRGQHSRCAPAPCRQRRTSHRAALPVTVAALARATGRRTAGPGSCNRPGPMCRHSAMTAGLPAAARDWLSGEASPLPGRSPGRRGWPKLAAASIQGALEQAGPLRVDRLGSPHAAPRPNASAWPAERPGRPCRRR